MLFFTARRVNKRETSPTGLIEVPANMEEGRLWPVSKNPSATPKILNISIRKKRGIRKARWERIYDG